MWKSVASNALTFLIVALLFVGGMIVLGKQRYESQGPLAQATCFQIERGTNMTRVSKKLEEQGAISSAALFRVGANYQDKSRALKAGSYLLMPNASMEEIVHTITRGGASSCGTEVVYRIGVNRMSVLVREFDGQAQKYVTTLKFDPSTETAPSEYADVMNSSDKRLRIALAEGVTSWQVVESLKAIDVLSGQVASLPAEGSLAPDSYEVSATDSRSDLIERMKAKQEKWLAQAWSERDEDLPISNPQELLILASLIEKETGVSHERGLVASAFVNRLNQGIKLQTDPTVIYGITKGQGILGRGLRRSELKKATPYNTYVIDALPPTPIANPGRASLMAAAQPDETDFIFFVADGTGGHAFAKTLDEHNKNVAKWREIEAQRAKDNNN